MDRFSFITELANLTQLDFSYLSIEECTAYLNYNIVPSLISSLSKNTSLTCVKLNLDVAMLLLSIKKDKTIITSFYIVDFKNFAIVIKPLISRVVKISKQKQKQDMLSVSFLFL